jgi:outer membrane protein OmpA-like peptidoglycan-associated protein
MPSVVALRALLGAGLGLGALDLVWIDAALAPRLIEPAPAPVVASPAPIVTPIEQPAPPPPPAPPAPVTTGVDHVYFETGSSTITPRGHKVLAALAGTTGQIALEGHADYRGTEALNKMLSRDRAVAVQAELVRLGVDTARIRLGYAGETQASSELWRDRRVDIQIVGGTR